MKPAAFDYVCPKTLSEAVELLAENDGAKILAGGQSLMPLLNFRMATPTLLVDLCRLEELRHIRIDGAGLELGAGVRWCDIEKDGQLEVAFPLLPATIAHVAHYQVRNRGTVGGSLAHADPAAEMPGLAVTCDAVLIVVGRRGTREIPAAEFFDGPLMTVLEPDEIIVAVRLPPWPAGRQWGFREFARRRGDFAFAGVTTYFDVDDSEAARNVHVGVIGACSTPRRLPSVENVIEGRPVNGGLIEEACRKICAAVDPPDDMHASAAYRRSLCSTLLGRALEDAISRRAH